MRAPEVIVLDTRGCTDKAQVLAAFARDLDFPDYFGHNWDALADCLGDFVTGEQLRLVVWTGASEIPPEVAETALEIVREAFTDSPAADIVIVDPPDGEEALMATREEIASIVDHTVLKPETTDADIAAHCAEAAELGVFSVCVSPSFLPLPADSLPASVAVCTVVGFPSGKHHSDIKAAEAAQAIANGADEIDMVIDVGAAVAGDWDAVAADIRAVRAATRGTLLKVIIESAALSDEQIVRVCQICEAEGADFVKTSTGFHPSGGASEHAVSLMRQTVGDRLGVKASGGIRTHEAAQAMIAAGASRLGLSGTRAVLDGAEPSGDY